MIGFDIETRYSKYRRMEKIAILIVNWNTGQLLARCLTSLAQLGQEEKDLIDEVIVVDNASSDNSVVAAEVMAGRNLNNPSVRFIRSSKNLGFARANNTGWERVKSRHGRAIHTLLLNPDTEVKAGAIREMSQLFNRRAKAGVVGPKLLNADGSIQPAIRNFPTFGQLVLLMLKLGRLVKWGDFDYGKEQAADQVMGAAFLIRDKVLEEIGGLDEGFWIWYEEVDYCRRAKGRGWEVWYTPRAQVIHHGAASFNQLAGWKKTAPWMRSLLYYARKHLPGWQTTALHLLVPVTIALSVPAGILHRLKRP